MSRRTAVGRGPVLLALLSLLAACNVSVSPPVVRQPDPSLVTKAGLAACPAGAGAAIAGGLPKLTLPCLDGTGEVDLADVRGPMLVNLYYRGCPDCIAEASYLRQFSTTAKGKVAVLGIDVDPYPDDGLQFEIDYGLHYPSLSDQHDAAPAKLKMIGFPTTYFVDAAGHLVGPTHAGPFRSYADVVAAVRSHLGITVS